MLITITWLGLHTFNFGQLTSKVWIENIGLIIDIEMKNHIYEAVLDCNIYYSSFDQVGERKNHTENFYLDYWPSSKQFEDDKLR